MTDEVRVAVLAEAARDEQIQLWGDLTAAIRSAMNGVWSVQCDNLRDRIVVLAGLVDATPWGHIDVTLLQSGVYTRILDEAGIAYPPIDWAQVAETEAAIMRGIR